MATRLHSVMDSFKTREGGFTQAVEKQTAQIPSMTWLTLAIGSILASVGFRIGNKKEMANFIGLWVPTFLLLGIYNKIVKLLGSE